MQISATSLSVTDLIEGPLYLWLQVHQNGVMMVALFTVLKKPVDGDDYLIEYLYGCGKYRMLVSAAQFDGSGDSPPLFPNYSRIFAASDSLYDRLYHMAFYQQLDVWLRYLGVKNPDQVSAGLSPNRLQFDDATPVSTYLPGRPVTISDNSVFEADYADLRPYPDVESEPFRAELRERISHPNTAPSRMQ